MCINKLVITLAIFFVVAACTQSKNTQLETNQFDHDLNVISQLHNPIVLSQGSAQIIVLAEYQGRVMTSTASGLYGESYGWINRENLLTPDKSDAVGGADRLWFGPETGEFSLFFKPGTLRTVENIVLPEAFSTLTFDVESVSDTRVTFTKQIALENHKGFQFTLDVTRTVSIFDKNSIERDLGITYQNVAAVGFGSASKITNVGNENWNKATGILSIWSLGAFEASDDNTAVIPVINELTTLKDYFSVNKASHTVIENEIVFYRTDAQYLNKIGIPPKNTKPIMGSYDATRKLLTIVTFQFNNAEDDLYVNSVWYPETAKPYDGDVINVFNGGMEDGVSLFGPFYELESSSNALELKIDESQYHFHNTYHFQGDENELNDISIELLGVSLSKINNVFR